MLQCFKQRLTQCQNDDTGSWNFSIAFHAKAHLLKCAAFLSTAFASLNRNALPPPECELLQASRQLIFKRIYCALMKFPGSQLYISLHVVANSCHITFQLYRAGTVGTLTVRSTYLALDLFLEYLDSEGARPLHTQLEKTHHFCEISWELPWPVLRKHPSHIR